MAGGKELLSPQGVSDLPSGKLGNALALQVTAVRDAKDSILILKEGELKRPLKSPLMLGCALWEGRDRETERREQGRVGRKGRRGK